MKRQIVLITLLITLLLIVACSRPEENLKEEILENGAEENLTYEKETYKIFLDDLLSEVSEFVDEKDLETIKTIIQENRESVGESIELSEIHLFEPVVNIITKYELEIFEDYYKEGQYDIEWAKEFMEDSDYNNLSELVEEVEDLELSSYFEEAKEVWLSIDELIDYYNGQFNEEDNTLLASDFYETYSNYEVEYGKYIYKTEPIDYVNEVVKDRGVVDHFVFMYWWDHILKLFPESHMKYIVGYDLTSDGWGGNYAMVWQDYDDERKWHLTIDPADALDEDYNYNIYMLDETLVHEFAHILTLNHDEMKRRRSTKSDNYTTDEGTLKEESYMNQFYQMFWSNIADEYLIETEYSDMYDDIKLYEDYPESFVSEYAATHPAEDIAESFIYFVTLDKPIGDSIKDMKITFFYDYPELVKMRDEIRSGIGNLKKEKK